jgi:hypothetical protein
MSLFSNVLQISFFCRVSPATKKEEIGKLKFIALLVYVHLSILQCCVCKLISNSVIFSNVSNFHLKKDPTGHFLVCVNDELDRKIRAYFIIYRLIWEPLAAAAVMIIVR